MPHNTPDLLSRFGRRRPAPAPAARITQRGYRKGCTPGNAGKRYPATPPTRDEMLRLLDACPGGKTGVRLRALFVVLWRSGLRISEALALLPHDVDFEQQTVRVTSGKGGKYRVSGIDLWALEQLQDWYAVRASLPIPDGSPLFCCVSAGSEGNRINPSFVQTAIKRLSLEAGIPHRVAPHQLRHGHACDLHREGASVHVISRQLGHSNLAVTAAYLAGISPEEVVQVVAARPSPELAHV